MPLKSKLARLSNLNSSVIVGVSGQSCVPQPNPTQDLSDHRQTRLRQTRDGRYGEPLGGLLHYARDTNAENAEDP